MIRVQNFRRSSIFAATIIAVFLTGGIASAATVEVITAENRFPVEGKETDWIDGDFVIANDQLIAVIAKPGPLRDANMTVRGVGAGVIDLSRAEIQSDQLSCFYPAGGRYQFFDAGRVEHGDLDDGGVFWRCRSSKALADNKSAASVEYQLRDGDRFLTVITTIHDAKADDVQVSHGVRADRTFHFGVWPETSMGYCEDEHFRQTYGLYAPASDLTPQWSSGRLKQLERDSAVLQQQENSVSWTTHLYPASSPIDLWGLTQSAAPQTFRVSGAVGVQPRIKLSILEGQTGPVKKPAVWRSAADGKSIVHLPAGEYRVRTEAIGHQPIEKTITVGSEAGTHHFELGPATTVNVNVTDERGDPVPCKVTIYGSQQSEPKTADPEFGLDSQSGSVGNCVYSVDGSFVRSLPPGTYDVLISRGPEFDVASQTITVQPNQSANINAMLKRTVDTTGWISAELHSHSTPSGDNTSEQLGRVENLICEHLEFAPCTEHQRIESYDDMLEILNAVDRMATCSGMELTGSPLPINHQNAFPLDRKPHAQDGGGPRTDGDPVAQIARLAMWDDNADKVVQTNHPNLRQIVNDRDLDGQKDGGFSKMLDYMDVMEVHPPDAIFATEAEIAKAKRPDNYRMKPWMGILKSGRRIPGVVNTDAHYNFHGSGWLRNWIRCSTDDPAQIATEEMIKRLERGEILMSTGPFMTVQLRDENLKQPAQLGDTVDLSDQQAELDVKVQCANWLDVNRVEVFVNGERREELSRTRAAHPDAFGDGVVKFEETFTVDLPEDAFIIVATIGEKLTLGRVMGPSYGSQPPVAVSNPIYIRSKK